MKQGIVGFACCYVFVALAALCILPVSSSNTVPNVQSIKNPVWRFDNEKNRDSRFQELYENISETKEIELDKRIASAVRFHPFIIVQFFLSTYVLLNHLIEPILPEGFRPTSRLQNLLMETIVHILEIFLRIQIPSDLSNQSGIFLEHDILLAARTDMLKLSNSREGQQIAYSLICVFNGSPGGSVAPLLIRNIPAFLRYLGIFILLYFPNYADNSMMHTFFGNLFSASQDSNSKENEKKNSKENEKKNSGSSLGSDSNTLKSNPKESQKSEKSTFDISINNSRVLADLISESVSLGLETFVLINSIINTPKAKDGKINPLLICKHLFCALLSFQYVSVRGKSFGAFVSHTFQGTKILENVRNSSKTYVLAIRNIFSLAGLMDLLKNSEESEKSEKSGKTMKKSRIIKKKTKGGKIAKKNAEGKPILNI